MFKKKRTTQINILEAFPPYVPGSSGSYAEKAALTIQGIQQLPSLALTLAESVGANIPQVEALENFCSETPSDLVNELEALLNHYGSDKADQAHQYHWLYAHVLHDKENVKKILEIGLGSNNEDVVSNMGKNGKPGASLQAFKTFLPNAEIYGADIDKRILFQEERINTFWVDQTDPKSLDVLADTIPDGFDVIIDDGLHSPNANIATLDFGLRKVRAGGWVIIEDIKADAETIWKLIGALLPQTYAPHLLRTSNGFMFAVCKGC